MTTPTDQIIALTKANRQSALKPALNPAPATPLKGA
ncbi:hypothetical protein SAMN06296065_1027 [Novosphingobium panipatense]|uniref:Uncharacterized protein n=1 Tax=Novosphingobium panipatense TaxID=428991 RepID=A0ABY1Q2K8_9SPHN|nr:hypothetical protein SAMN06296065_1027 [Novosphingobium panipatense]